MAQHEIPITAAGASAPAAVMGVSEKGVNMTNKRDLTAEELSAWWKHGVVLIGLSVIILSWWIGNA